MYFSHAGIVCTTEEKCDRFYQNVLGLEKQQSKCLPSDISKALFNLDEEYQLLYYGNQDLLFEIFLSSRPDYGENRIGHLCIEVDNLEQFLEKCAANHVEILKVPKGEKFVIFIKDYDGNLFETKERI
jgi:catechol 2,3-dioxygenase-like lactoylglutathione lyase family enzyme